MQICLVVLSKTPLKNHGLRTSWDDEMHNIWKVIKFMFQTTNQLPVIYFTQIHKLDQGHTVADIKEQDIDDIWMPNRYDFPYCSYLDVTGK